MNSCHLTSLVRRRRNQKSGPSPSQKKKSGHVWIQLKGIFVPIKTGRSLNNVKFSVAFPPTVATVAKFCGTFLWLVNCILKLMTQCKNNKDVPHSGRPHATQSKAKSQGKENNGCHRAAHHTTVMALTRPDGIV